MPSRTRRSIIASVTPGLVLTGSGCFGNRSTTAETSSPSESGPTIETTIDLVLPSASDVDEEPIQPLVFENLPRNERKILRTAHEERTYSVSYGGYEGLPDAEETDGLQSLIDRIRRRLASQTEAYREEHDADSVPEHVDAVYLEYGDEVYCIDLIDGDQKHYHC